MLLYKSLRLMLRYSLELYFVDIQATGTAEIPRTGPIIFAANHPNSIMDTVILGTQTYRSICYLARSGLFANPLVAALFNQCGVIPIFRAQDGASKMTGNESSFRRAYEVLQEGGCIGIFPEGKNSQERKLHRIKTGTARIALGAEAAGDYDAGVKIIPVGLNFENRDRFLSSVLVRFGEPIEVRDYADQHREDAQGAVRALTSEIEDKLRAEAVHIEDEKVQSLVRDISDIYGKKLARDVLGKRTREKGLVDLLFGEVRATPERKSDLEGVFWLKKRIADAIVWFDENEPGQSQRLKQAIQRYKDHLNQVDLRHDFLDRPPESLSIRRDSIKFTLYAIAFALPAVWGLVHNLLPYMVARVALMKAPDEAMRAFTAFCVSMVMFPLWYGLEGYGLWRLTGAWWAVAGFLLTLPPTGFFWLRYRRQLARYRDRVLTRTLFRTNRNLIRTLGRERARLLATFDQLKEKFIEAEGSQVDEFLASTTDK